MNAVLQALADPHRRRMVERLVNGPASVSELARPFTMSLPAVLQHLAVLEACGLVRSEKSGRVRVCRLNPGPLEEAEGWFADQHTLWQRHLDNLGSFLDETQPTTKGQSHD